MNNPRVRQVLGLILAVMILTLGFEALQDYWRVNSNVKISDVAAAVKRGEVERLVVDGDDVSVYLKGDKKLIQQSRKEASGSLVEQLAQYGVTPEQRAAVQIEVASGFRWLNSLGTLLQILLPLALLYFVFSFFRQMQNGSNNAMSFGRSRARLLKSENPTVTFADVAGADEAKQELQEVVEFLKQPEKFIQLGARIPKGVLLVGAPGTGKTLLAKAVSGEAGVPFFSISGSEFVEMFVGVGASRVRDLFEQARKASPCIIFIDEIDAVGRSRGTGVGGGNDEREQTLNQILVEMDGFGTDTNVIVVAATNRPDVLDAALLRPGRFDRRVVLDRPDVKGREAILKVHTRGKPLDAEVELGVIAKSTPGFAGAELENLVNEAAILAARRNKKIIGNSELLESVERVMMGPERKSRLITDKTKRLTAYHEAGHAIVGHLLPNCDPVQKVTIIPRGMAGGYTLFVPDSDDLGTTRGKFLDTMAMALGGRVAEEIALDDITTGASGDLQRVTEIARDMVTRYGMSDKLAPMAYGQKQEMVFLGRDLGEQRDYSESVAQDIDREVQRLVNDAYARAKEILTKNRDILDALAAKLIEIESIDAEGFRKFFEAQNRVFNPRAAIKPVDGPSNDLPPAGKPAPVPV